MLFEDFFFFFFYCKIYMHKDVMRKLQIIEGNGVNIDIKNMWTLQELTIFVQIFRSN